MTTLSIQAAAIAAIRAAASAYDDLCRKREDAPNVYRIGFILEGIERAETLIATGWPIRKALCAIFKGPVLDALLRTAGERSVHTVEIYRARRSFERHKARG